MLDAAMAQALTVLELSERCGEPVDHLLIWRRAGLVGADGTELFAPADLQRIRHTASGAHQRAGPSGSERSAWG